MRFIFAPLIIFALVIICAFHQKKTLIVSSTAFAEDGIIPDKYTRYGQSVSPPIKIGNIPDGTQSFALMMIEPNAPERNGFTHWLVWNIDRSGVIPENYVSNFTGRNSAMQYGYTAIAPTSGTHRYHIKVYALDTKLNLRPETTTPTDLEKAIRGRILAQGELTGWYNIRN